MARRDIVLSNFTSKETEWGVGMSTIMERFSSLIYYTCSLHDHKYPSLLLFFQINLRSDCSFSLLNYVIWVSARK